jgi:hypothetical protein
MIGTPWLLVKSNFFFIQNINIWSFEHILIRKSEPTKFSRLCTFIIGAVHQKRCCQADQAAPCPSFAATNASARGQPGPQVIRVIRCPPPFKWSCRWCPPTAPSASSKLYRRFSHSQLLLCTLSLSNYRGPRNKKTHFVIKYGISTSSVYPTFQFDDTVQYGTVPYVLFLFLLSFIIILIIFL